MKIYLAIITLLFQFSVISIKAQTLKYEILVKGHKIGVLTAHIQKGDSLRQVAIEANCKLQFVLEEDVKYQVNSIYIHDTLSYSSTSIYRNNKLEFTSIVEKQDGFYTITKNKHEQRFMGEIIYSGSMLYFEEPDGIASIFSEIDNIGKSIIKTANHTYDITNPKTNNTSTFTYKDGVLENAQIVHTYMDLTINRIPN